MNQNQIYDYREYRRRGMSAARALYTVKTQAKRPNYRPAPDHGRGTDGALWCTVPEAIGFRIVGYVEPEMRRGAVFHNDAKRGWYADTFCENTYCGVVVQLPARDGVATYYPGWYGRGNDAYEIDLSWPFMTDPRAGAEDSDEKIAAARAADDMARRAAENARDYDAAWQAGALYAGNLEAIAEERRAALALLAERRAARGMAGFPAICAAIRRRVEEARRCIEKLRDENARLLEGDNGDHSFYMDQEARSAFCDGAGLVAFPS